LVQDPREPAQAFTVRLPAREYQLLRALAFQEDRSINELVSLSISRLLDAGDRRHLQAVLDTARESRVERGLPSALPANPSGRGPKPRLR